MLGWFIDFRYGNKKIKILLIFIYKVDIYKIYKNDNLGKIVCDEENICFLLCYERNCYVVNLKVEFDCYKI